MKASVKIISRDTPTDIFDECGSVVGQAILIGDTLSRIRIVSGDKVSLLVHTDLASF